MTTLTSVHPSTQLRSIFRRAASSVWVVTSHSADGPIGLTALSVHSVSLEPALISFNLNRASNSAQHIYEGKQIAAHLLAEGQQHLSTRFAGNRDLRFVDDGAWGYDGSELPELYGVSARLTATVVDRHPAGDSFLVIASVDDGEHTSSAKPLVHHDGHHHLLTNTLTDAEATR